MAAAAGGGPSDEVPILHAENLISNVKSVNYSPLCCFGHLPMILSTSSDGWNRELESEKLTGGVSACTRLNERVIASTLEDYIQ